MPFLNDPFLHLQCCFPLLLRVQLLHSISQQLLISCIFFNTPCFYHAFLLASQYTWNSPVHLVNVSSIIFLNPLRSNNHQKISPWKKTFPHQVLILVLVLLLYPIYSSITAYVTLNYNLFKCLVLYLNNPQENYIHFMSSTQLIP